MSTQKNEHNPDKISPEIVGEGWRLLNDGEPQQAGDEWWDGLRWEPNEEEDYGHRYRYISVRRRITPPPDTTGSGREGETPETDAVETTRIALGQPRTPAYGDMMACSKRIERQRDAALAEVEALRRDGERLDWLEKNAAKELKIDNDGTYVQLDRWHRKYITAHSWTEPTLRAAIDSAQRQEKP